MLSKLLRDGVTTKSSSDLDPKETLGSSPRTVETLPHSPIQDNTDDVSATDHTPRDMMTPGFLFQSGRVTLPIPIPSTPQYNKKMAYKPSDKQPMYMQGLLASRGEIFDTNIASSSEDSSSLHCFSRT